MYLGQSEIQYVCLKLDFPADAQADLCAALDAVLASEYASWFADMIDGYVCEEPLPSWQEILDTLTELAPSVGASPYVLHMLLLVLLAKPLLERYQEAGISMAIWQNSMSDLTCKLHECRKMHGVNGTFVAKWVSMFYDMKIFGLGRLEFEPAYTKTAYTVGDTVYPAGTPMLKVHIPSKGKLAAEDCLDAFARAVHFFDGRMPEYKVGNGFLFSCHSWLLDPRLQQILPPTSGILAFADLFTLVDSSVSAQNDCMWRIYYKDADRAPADLPRDTSLQRAYADFLLAGNLPGEGMGLRYVPCP